MLGLLPTTIPRIVPSTCPRRGNPISDRWLDETTKQLAPPGLHAQERSRAAAITLKEQRSMIEQINREEFPGGPPVLGLVGPLFWAVFNRIRSYMIDH